MHKLLVLALFISTVTCATITVPWAYGMTPQNINAAPGDRLLWKWSNKYTVANCTLSEFQRCDCSNIMTSSSPFAWEVPDVEGTYFFASSVGTHCSDGGVKLVVIVSKESKEEKLNTLNKRQTNQDTYLQPPITNNPNPSQPVPPTTNITNDNITNDNITNDNIINDNITNDNIINDNTTYDNTTYDNTTYDNSTDLSLCYDSCYYVWYNLCQNLWYNLTMYNLTNPSYNFTLLCNQSTSFDNLTITWTNWTNPWNLTDINGTDLNSTMNPCWNIWFNSTDNSTSSDNNTNLDNSTVLADNYTSSSLLMLASPWTNTTSTWFNMAAFCQNPCVLAFMNTSDNSTNPWYNYGNFFSSTTAPCWLNESDSNFTINWENSILANVSTWSNFSSPCFGLWYQLCYVPWNTLVQHQESALSNQFLGPFQSVQPQPQAGSSQSQPQSVPSTATLSLSLPSSASQSDFNTSLCYNPCYYTWYNFCFDLWYNGSTLNLTNSNYDFAAICVKTQMWNNISSMWNNFSNPWVRKPDMTGMYAGLDGPCSLVWLNMSYSQVNGSYTRDTEQFSNVTSLYYNMTSSTFNLTDYCSQPCSYLWSDTNSTNQWSSYSDMMLNSSSPCSDSCYDWTNSESSDSNFTSPCFILWYSLCSASPSPSPSQPPSPSAIAPQTGVSTSLPTDQQPAPASSTSLPTDQQSAPASSTSSQLIPTSSVSNSSLCYNPCYYTWYNLCFDLWYNQSTLNITNPTYNFTTLCIQGDMWDNISSSWNNFSNPWIRVPDLGSLYMAMNSNPCWNIWYNITNFQVTVGDTELFSNMTNLYNNMTDSTFNLTDYCSQPCSYLWNDTNSMNYWSSYSDMMLNSSSPCSDSCYDWTNSSANSNFSSPCYNVWYNLCSTSASPSTTVPTQQPSASTPSVPVSVPSFEFTDNMTICFNPCYYAWYHMCFQLWYNETVLNITNQLYNFTSICNQSESFTNITSMWTNYTNPWLMSSNSSANLTLPSANLTLSSPLNFTDLDQSHPCWTLWYNTTLTPELVNITIPTDCPTEPNITSVWQNITSPEFDLSNFCISPCYYFWNSSNSILWSNYSDFFLNSSSPCSNSSFNVSTPNVTQWLNVSSPCFSIWYELCYVPWNNSNFVSETSQSGNYSVTAPQQNSSSQSNNNTISVPTQSGNDSSTSPQQNSTSQSNSSATNQTAPCSNPCFDLWYKICFTSSNSSDLNSLMANATQQWYNSTVTGPCFNPWYNMSVGNSSEWCLAVKMNATNGFYDMNQFVNYVWSCYDDLVRAEPVSVGYLNNYNNVTLASSGFVASVSAVMVMLGCLILMLV